ncbi:SseB family protein [Weissella kandleri]|uniref:SseB family protein n=1 Tax=Weissella kandleri TaxID=1616 RepID=UPI00387E99F8
MIDLNNTELLNALAHFRVKQTPKFQTEFELALLNAQFLAPVQVPAGAKRTTDGTVTVKPGEPLQFVSLMAADGEPVLPIFTDDKNYQATPQPWEPDIMVVQFPFAQFVEMFKQDPTLNKLVMNPFSEEGMEITRENIEYMLDIYAPDEHQHAATHYQESDGAPELEIVTAENIPTSLQAELMGLADDMQGVISEMYMLWMKLPDGYFADEADAPFKQPMQSLLILNGDSQVELQQTLPQFEEKFDEMTGGTQQVQVLLIDQVPGLNMDEFEPFYVY